MSITFKHPGKANDSDLEPTTVEHLAALLVSSNNIISNSSFVFSFFLSSRVSVSNYDLLELIFEKSIHFISTFKTITKEIISESLSRFMLILSEWAKYFPYDFRAKIMIDNIYKIKKKCLALDDYFAKDFDTIIAYLTKKNQDLSNYENYLKCLHYETMLKIKSKSNEVNILEICHNDSKLLAIQLTHIEFDRLSHVAAEEFIHYFLSKGYNDKTTPVYRISEKYIRKFDYTHFMFYLEDLKQSTKQGEIIMDPIDETIQYYTKTAANLEAYILWFNRLSNFVASKIVMCFKKDERVELIEFFIDVAYECFQLENFNSSMAIIAALNFLHVTRLKKTWLRVDTTKLKILTDFTDSSNNYFKYRKILNEKFKENKANSKVIIPIFSLVMRDLNHLFYSLPSKNFKGFLNIERFWEMGKYISRNIIIKSKKFHFIQHDQIINHLLTAPILTVEACALASFHLEEPESNNQLKYYNELKNSKSSTLDLY